MANTDGVLTAIDSCLDDYAVSDDAMRWAPDEPGPTASLDIRLDVDLSQFFNGMAQAVRVIAEGLDKALAPMRKVGVELHKRANQGDRKHYRRCATCNPLGFPKGMSIDRGEYSRRQRRGNRRG